MENGLEEVYEDSDIQPLSKAAILHLSRSSSGYSRTYFCVTCMITS
jgi:hypothetical protein